MAIGIEGALAPPGQDVRTGPRLTLWTMRSVALLQAVAVVAQPVLAGMYLGGEFDALGLHATNATVLILMAMVQIVAAAAVCWPGGGRIWPLVFTTGMFFAVGFQTGMGYARELGIHIPLGVAIVASQIAFTLWVCTARAGKPRTWGRRR